MTKLIIKEADETAVNIPSAAELDSGRVYEALHLKALALISDSNFTILNTAIEGDKEGSTTFYGAGENAIVAIFKTYAGKDEEDGKWLVDPSEIDKKREEAFGVIQTYINWMAGPDVAGKIKIDLLKDLKDGETATEKKEEPKGESYRYVPKFSTFLLTEEGEEDSGESDEASAGSEAEDAASASDDKAEGGDDSADSSQSDNTEAMPRGFYINYVLKIPGKKTRKWTDVLGDFAKSFLSLGIHVLTLGSSIYAFGSSSGKDLGTLTIGDLVKNIWKAIKPSELLKNYDAEINKTFKDNEIRSLIWTTNVLTLHIKNFKVDKKKSADIKILNKAKYAIASRVDKNDPTYPLLKPLKIAELLTVARKKCKDKGAFLKLMGLGEWDGFKADDVIVVNNYDPNKKLKGDDKDAEFTNDKEKGAESLDTSSIDVRKLFKQPLISEADGEDGGDAGGGAEGGSAPAGDAAPTPDKDLEKKLDADFSSECVKVFDTYVDPEAGKGESDKLKKDQDYTTLTFVVYDEKMDGKEDTTKNNKQYIWERLKEAISKCVAFTNPADNSSTKDPAGTLEKMFSGTKEKEPKYNSAFLIKVNKADLISESKKWDIASSILKMLFEANDSEKEEKTADEKLTIDKKGLIDKNKFLDIAKKVCGSYKITDVGDVINLISAEALDKNKRLSRVMKNDSEYITKMVAKIKEDVGNVSDKVTGKMYTGKEVLDAFNSMVKNSNGNVVLKLCYDTVKDYKYVCVLDLEYTCENPPRVRKDERTKPTKDGLKPNEYDESGLAVYAIRQAKNDKVGTEAFNKCIDKMKTVFGDALIDKGKIPYGYRIIDKSERTNKKDKTCPAHLFVVAPIDYDALEDIHGNDENLTLKDSLTIDYRKPLIENILSTLEEKDDEDDSAKRTSENYTLENAPQILIIPFNIYNGKSTKKGVKRTDLTLYIIPLPGLDEDDDSDEKK